MKKPTSGNIRYLLAGLLIGSLIVAYAAKWSGAFCPDIQITITTEDYYPPEADHADGI